MNILDVELLHVFDDFIERHAVLGMRFGVADDDAFFDGFFLAHDDGVGNVVFFDHGNLRAESVLGERLIDGDPGFAQEFKNAERKEL